MAVRACNAHAACRARVQRKRDAREWAYYRAHPMPYCTWGPESGGSYTALNAQSGAGGKYQFLPSTWHAVGGYGLPNQAPPLLQERLARKLLAEQGTRPWVNC